MTETEPVLWMVVVENGIYYTRTIIQDELSEEEAEKLKNSFRENKANPEHFHKVGYEKFAYTRSTKTEVMRRERVNLQHLG